MVFMMDKILLENAAYISELVCNLSADGRCIPEELNSECRSEVLDPVGAYYY